MTGLILHTEIIGEGEPLVFLHTGLQTGMTDFNYQREYFKNKYKVILPDLRGHVNLRLTLLRKSSLRFLLRISRKHSCILALLPFIL